MTIRILPVLDILNGVVVRGIGGRRSEYEPIVSRIADTAEPISVATAIRRRFGFSELYVADLDGIMHSRPNVALYGELTACGFNVWVDAGVRTFDDAIQVHLGGAQVIVAGLETLDNAEQLRRMVARFGADRICLSLDLKAGSPIGGPNWGSDVDQIVAIAVEAGVRTILVLDLADVGEARGPSTMDLCRTIHDQHPQLTLAAGGGVRDRNDLLTLEATGVSIALVGSAIHDGRLDVPG